MGISGFTKTTESELVIVIKDNVDVRNLIDCQHFFLELARDRFLTIYAPHEKEGLAEALASIINAANGVDFKCLPHARIMDKIKTWFFRIVYFVQTYRFSISSRQKLLELMNLPDRVCFSNILASFPSLSTDRHLNSLSIINIEPSEILRNQKVLCYMRSDASQNAVVKRNHEGAYSVNVLRNVDTIYTKGPFVVSSDTVINLWGGLIDETLLGRFCVKKVISLEPQRLVEIPRDTSRYVEKSRVKVLYATSHPRFVPDETRIVSALQRQLGWDCDLYIKIHCADSSENYSNLQLKLYDFGDLKNIALHGEERERHLSELKSFDCVISTTSTFLVDAFIAGVDQLYYVNDPKFFYYSSLYLREHLKNIIEDLSVTVIENLDEFDYER